MSKAPKKRLKILLVCITNKNLGDTVIADCTEFLIKKILGDRAQVLRYSISCHDTMQIQYADAVIFAGGGLIKFKAEEFYLDISEICQAAQEYDVPVFFNAVGIEGFDENDERCLVLKKALELDCVKGLSVRDDAELLREKWLKDHSKRITEVLGPAVWAAQTYGIRGNSSEQVIGLGIARDRLFSDYGIEDIDRSFLLDYWKYTALLLEKRGHRWKLFTNGLDSDERFAAQVLEYIGHGEKLPQPVYARELCRNIGGFSGIIAQRMHSTIIACSLGVPAVGLVWNDKVRFWFEKTGFPERALQKDQLTAQISVDTLEKALEQGVKQFGYFKRRACEKELAAFLKKYVQPGERQVRYPDLRYRVIETGLGGVAMKYKALNCSDEMARRAMEGCRLFEADVRATCDGRAVCINGWSEKNLKMLGLDIPENIKNGVSFKEFEGSLYKEHYPAATFEDAVKVISKYTRSQLVIDVGKPPKELTQSLFEDICSILRHYLIEESRVMIRLQREGDVALWRQWGYGCREIYYLPDAPNEAEQKAALSKAVKSCQKLGIDLISMSFSAFTDDTAHMLQIGGIKPVVFSFHKTADLLQALDKGAYMAGSFYYSAAYISSLVND